MNYKVLIADDEEIERNVVEFLLNKHFPGKFQILRAANGKEALEIVQKETVNILLSDVQMPFLSGIELAREVRLFNPDIELLFFSGYDDFEYVQGALLLHAVNYVLKPLNQEQFSAAIQEMLSRLESRTITFSKTQLYYDSTFYDSQKGQEEKKWSGESDSELLQHISKAVSLKQPETILVLANQLLGFYSISSERSPVYIRSVITELLRLIINAIPTLTTADLDMVLEEIFTFRYFSDIERTVRKYLDILIDVLTRAKDESNYPVFRVQQYIETHYSEELTLSSLADYVYLSPNYLSNIFSKATGCSLNKYIQQVRMKKAQELLIHTNMKVSEVSKRVGYPTTSYFIKTFRRLYNKTPLAFRQEHIISSVNVS